MNLNLKKIAVKVLAQLPTTVQDSTINKYLYYKKKNLKVLKTPTAVILYVTNKCNLKCNHCFYWDSLNKKTDELSANEIAKIVDSLKHPISLSLTGGEPFLRGDLPEIIDSFIVRKRVKEIGITSNGFMTDKVVSFCERYCLEHKNIPLSVQISLDGLEVVHDSIRRVNGSFKRALDTINKLHELTKFYDTFSVSAGIAVQKKNLSEILELIDLLETRNVEIRINLIRGETSGTYGVAKYNSSHFKPKEGSEIALDIEEVRFLYDALCQKNEKYGFWTKRHKRIYEICMQVLEKRKKFIDCYAGTIDAVIYPNGDVAFCELTRPIGNLRNYDFDMQKLWNSNDALSMRSKVKKCFCIHGCNISTALMFDPEIIKESLLNRL